MFTPWTADRWGYNPVMYELNGVMYVSPGTYGKLVQASALGAPLHGGMKIVQCAYMTDYRAVPEPCWKGWWLS